jgi:uncharacterized protein (UPF0264 family)
LDHFQTPGLLVSFRSPQEFEHIPLESIDVIDLKEPTRGALAAVDPGTVRETVFRLRDRESAPPISIALGELPDSQMVRFRAELPLVKFAKVGLAGTRSLKNWASMWHERFLSVLPPSTQPVAVAYADHLTCDAPEPDDVLDHAILAGVPNLLLDTFDKSRGSSLEILGDDRIRTLARRARENGMRFVLAGKIDRPLLGRAISINPDLIAVRGAVTATDRTSRVCTDRLRSFALALKSLRQEPQPTANGSERGR